MCCSTRRDVSVYKCNIHFYAACHMLSTRDTYQLSIYSGALDIQHNTHNLPQHSRNNHIYIRVVQTHNKYTTYIHTI